MSEREPDLPPGGTLLDADPSWQPWQPAEVAALLEGVRVPWYVAGGWALDLFRGRQSREHEDIEVGVPNTAPAFAEIRRALHDYEFDVVGGPPPGRCWPTDGEAFAVIHQTWVRDPGTGSYKLDVFREPQRDGRWVCRRDDAITEPYQRIIRRTADGIPYLVPEVVLLFKAKHARTKDEFDLAATLPLLDASARGWLRRALERVHPGHSWLGRM